MTAAKRVFRYLKSTSNYRLHYGNSNGNGKNNHLKGMISLFWVAVVTTLLISFVGFKKWQGLKGKYVMAASGRIQYDYKQKTTIILLDTRTPIAPAIVPTANLKMATCFSPATVPFFGNLGSKISSPYRLLKPNTSPVQKPSERPNGYSNSRRISTATTAMTLHRYRSITIIRVLSYHHRYHKASGEAYRRMLPQ